LQGYRATFPQIAGMLSPEQRSKWQELREGHRSERGGPGLTRSLEMKRSPIDDTIGDLFKRFTQSFVVRVYEPVRVLRPMRMP
jgi:hypothetical protein